MKRTILILFVVLVSIGQAQQIHDKRFFKKTTNININLDQYLANQGFTEIIIYYSMKANLFSTPNNGALYNMNNAYECLYDVRYQYLDLNPYPLEISYETPDNQRLNPIFSDFLY